MSSPVTTRWSCAATPRRSPSWKASPSASTSSRGSNYSIPELLDTGLPGDADERIAAFEHVVERAERIHIVSAEAVAFDPSEHVAEIDVALAGRQVHLVPIAEAVGEAHLLDPADIERVDKSGDALRHQMRMVGGMQAEADAVPLAGGAHRRGALVADRAERVGAGIKLQVYDPHLVRCGPFDRFFERQFTADIAPDAVAQTKAHRTSLAMPLGVIASAAK